MKTVLHKLAVMLTFVVGGLLSVSAEAQQNQSPAGIETKQFAPDARTLDFCIQKLQVNTPTVAHPVGDHGVIASIDTRAASAPVLTSSLGAMPYPARVLVRYLDLGAASTLACSGNVDLEGWDQFGMFRTERITGAGSANGADETEQNSRYVYERLTRFSASGCSAYGSGSISSADRLVVATSDQIGLRVPIANASDLIQMSAIGDGGNIVHSISGSDSTYDQSIGTDYSYVDLEATETGNAEIATHFGISGSADEQTLCFRVRASSSPKTRYR